jgi:hypothetical protein
VYTGSGSTFALQQKLIASDGAAGDEFGRAVEIEGDVAIIGSHAAAAYVFKRSSSVWAESQVLTTSTATTRFGHDVSIEGNVVVVSEPINTGFGVAHVFKNAGSGFVASQALTTTDIAVQNEFETIGFDGKTIVIGAPDADLASGRAYVFVDGHAPTNITLSGTSVAENKAAGTLVGSFSSSDADSGDTHTYALVPGTGATNNSSFTIASGQLKTAEMFNYENKSSYSVRVRSTDSTGRYFEKAFTISITNVSESNRAPVCSKAMATPNLLVANSSASFATIAVGNVTDADRDNVTIKITRIRQDEPIKANSSDPSPDGSGVGGTSAMVRQQAVATGNGRVYYIGFTATDVNKASCSCEVRVGVKPKSTSGTPVASGSNYDSTR